MVWLKPISCRLAECAANSGHAGQREPHGRADLDRDERDATDRPHRPRIFRRHSTRHLSRAMTHAAKPSPIVADRPSGAPGIRYSGDARRAVAVPLGGLGAGHVAIAGDGSLRQWQLANTVNHGGFVPDSFFALRLSSIEPPLDVRRTLRSEPIRGDYERAPLSTDDLEPRDHRPPTLTWPAVQATDVTVAYPFVAIDFVDPALPLQVAFEAWTPFVPLDA